MMYIPDQKGIGNEIRIQVSGRNGAMQCRWDRSATKAKVFGSNVDVISNLSWGMDATEWGKGRV
jgi:hypothetical protein